MIDSKYNRCVLRDKFDIQILMVIWRILSSLAKDILDPNVPVWNSTLTIFCNGLVIFSLIVDGALRSHKVVVLWCLMKEKGVAIIDHISYLLHVVGCIMESHLRTTNEVQISYLDAFD